MKQLIEDLKLLIKTDKRIAAAFGFIALVLLVWSLTDSWRPLPEVVEEKYVSIDIMPEKIDGPILEGLTKSLSELTQTHKSLGSDIARVSQNLEAKQEEIDWNVDKLVSRLSDMSSTLDSITQKVGERQVEKFKSEERMKAKDPDSGKRRR